MDDIHGFLRWYFDDIALRQGKHPSFMDYQP